MEEIKTEQTNQYFLVLFHVETVLGLQRTDQMSHRDRSRATWKQNTSALFVEHYYYLIYASKKSNHNHKAAASSKENMTRFKGMGQ